MMRRSLVAVLALSLAAMVSQVPTAHAGSSTQGFVDQGTPQAGGSPTGDINTATKFIIGDLQTTSAQTGFFVGMATQDIGQVSFDSTSGSSLDFGNSVFGTFSSTSITEVTNVPGVVGFYVLGNYTPGTQGGNSGLASFTLSFTQTAPGSSISNSGTFSIPPAAVPEPSSVVMGLTGIAACGLVCVWQRRTRKATR
jgi:hypothetical protein